MPAAESNKARIAKRVIEVLEFFDEEHPQATVMDIVRRFDRPQSSTSELLSNLVSLGLLYKDRHSRSYSLTPRAALLGAVVQPGIIADGRLTGLMDRQASQTGLALGLFSLVGTRIQICSWRSGKRPLHRASAARLHGGQQDQLSESAAGWLLLSTIAPGQREGVIRRLNAEAADDRKFVFADMVACVQQCGEQGHAHGSAGFGASARTTAILLPGMPDNRPLALGFVYEPSEQIDPNSLLDTLRDAAARCVEEDAPASASIRSLHHAA